MTTTFTEAFAGKRIFVTGHTGFKGAWLSFWLAQSGAEVTGYSLEPPTQPSLFEALGLARDLRSIVADVRDPERLASELQAARPEVVLHLAAQAIVRTGYAHPRGTYETNVMGTVNLLEAARACDTVRAVIVVTSDKCYQNLENGRPFKESDAMGGQDPYSSSKGCAELVAGAYQASFFAPTHEQASVGRAVGLATVRAGNVIGGGDWATDRIVPDCVRALAAGVPIVVRNPRAVRPWQHVLEPLSGYLWLAALMLRDAQAYSGPWNFGPDEADGSREVRWVVDTFLQEWGNGRWTTPQPEPVAPHEATLLNLDSSKAKNQLGWHSTWDALRAVRQTAAWYRDYCMAVGSGSVSPSATEVSRALTSAQIASYEADARAAGLAWAVSEGGTPGPRR
jgi:CDP-glucose 4,6-dehydratase